MTKKWIELNITLECNWKCPCCVRLCNIKQKNPNSVMDINDIKYITSEINDIGSDKFEHVTIIGGEPTTNPYFVDICRYLKDNLNTKLEVSTNSSNNSKYKDIIESMGIKYYTFNNLNNMNKKKYTHFNFYISPTENNQELKKDCGLNCGVSICKINNEFIYSHCSNQIFVAQMLQKQDILFRSLKDVMTIDSYDNIVTNTVCKHCQFMAKDRIRYFKNSNISQCFKDGLKEYDS